MFCRYCGQQLKDGSSFCIYCGKQLSKPQAPVNTAADEKTMMLNAMSAPNNADDEKTMMLNVMSAPNNANDEKTMMLNTMSAPNNADDEKTMMLNAQSGAQPVQQTYQAPQSVQANVQTPTQTPASALQDKPIEIPPVKKKKWVVALIVALICLVVLGGGGFAAYYFLMASPSAQTKKMVKEATAYADAGDYSNAITTYDSLLLDDPTNANYYRTVADLYEKQAEICDADGDENAAAKLRLKEIKTLESAYENTKNEEFYNRAKMLKKMFAALDMTSGYVVSDEENIYILQMDPEYKWGKILKQSKDGSFDSAETLTELSFSKYAPYLGGLMLKDDRIYYWDWDTNGSQGELFWISKDGKDKGMYNHEKVFVDYLKKVEGGQARSVYRIYQSAPSYFADGFQAQPMWENENVFARHHQYMENDLMLYDSTFLINLTDDTIEPIPFPDKDKYVYASLALYANKVYYIKFGATSYESEKRKPSTDIYVYDLEEKKEEKFCSVDLSPLDLMETAYCFNEDGFFFLDSDNDRICMFAYGGKTIETVCHECHIEDDYGNFLINNGKAYYTGYGDDYSDVGARQCEINGDNDKSIPSFAKTANKYDDPFIWGIAGEYVYYMTYSDEGVVCGSLTEKSSGKK